jgi:hypothetical protein
VGVVHSKRQYSKKSKQALPAKIAPKVLVYEALATLNRDFEQVLCDLERLEELRLFPRRWQRHFLKAWRASLEETERGQTSRSSKSSINERSGNGLVLVACASGLRNHPQLPATR